MTDTKNDLHNLKYLLSGSLSKSLPTPTKWKEASPLMAITHESPKSFKDGKPMGVK